MKYNSLGNSQTHSQSLKMLALKWITEKLKELVVGCRYFGLLVPNPWF